MHIFLSIPKHYDRFQIIDGICLLHAESPTIKSYLLSGSIFEETFAVELEENNPLPPNDNKSEQSNKTKTIKFKLCLVIL